MNIAEMVKKLIEEGYANAPARAKVAHDIFLAAIKAAYSQRLGLYARASQ